MTVLELGACFCGQPATRTLGSVAYCERCLEGVLRPIRKRVAQRHGIGFGEQHGPLRPDWGQNWAELRCCLCDAGWVGPIGEPCTWCRDSLEHMQEWQAEILLDPELPEVDDDRYEAAVEAWGERLGRAVIVELITINQARAAIQREKKRHD